jgi:glucose/arabinose dehydrogenase
LTALGAASTQAQDEPGWAKGRPKTDEAMKMAPVPAFPVPTPADQLPVSKFKLPPGFKVEVWASNVLDARGLRQGEKNNIFVSTLFVANKVYVIPESGKHEAKVIIDNMPLATGIEIHKGSLYLATNTKIMRYDNVESNLDKLGEPTVIYDKLPGGTDHSWKYLRIRATKLYYAVGAPCNICDPGEWRGSFSMNLEGRTSRRSPGRAEHGGLRLRPEDRQSLVHRQRARLVQRGAAQRRAERGHQPASSISATRLPRRATSLIRSSAGASRATTSQAARRCWAARGSLGLKFYTGKMFPAKYQGAMFIASHGPVEPHQEVRRTSVAWPDGKGGAKVEPFMTGFVENQHLPQAAGGLPPGG